MTSSTTYPTYLDAKFDDFCEALLKEWHIPGASLAVVDGNNIYTKTYGVTKPGGPKVTEDTLFNAASMSKSFTASAVALVVDDDEKYPHVKWDTPVSAIMREDFVLSDPYCTQNVTIRDMLSHRTGMAGHNDISLGIDAKHPSTPRSMTRLLRDLPIAKPLRSVYQYQNQMYTASSYLVEKVTGQSFADVLKTRFWTPLGMDGTYFAVARTPKSASRDSSTKPEATVGCYWDKKTQSYTELPESVAPEGQGAGNIVSSAKDWGKWIHANIHGTHAISTQSFEEMTRPAILAYDLERFNGPHQSPVFYGMGWFVRYYRGYKIVTHPGGIPGFGSLQTWLPEKKWGVVIFGNSAGVYVVSDTIASTLIDEVLGVPREERTDWSQRNRDIEKRAGEEAEKEQNIFPDRTDPPLSLSLPLSAYVGRYEHPAYHDLWLEIRDGGMLFADAPDRTFPYTLTFEHVSGDFFTAEKEDKPKSAEHGNKLKAKFEVGVNGTVKELGIDFMHGDYTWFDKLD